LFDTEILTILYLSGYIIKDMELRSLESGYDVNWVANTMKLSQIPLLQLLQSY